MNLHSEVLRKNWLPVCKSCELKKKPLHIKLLDEEIVLFRNDDNISALRDRCPHRNVPLSEGLIISNCIQCPYHGWKFDGLGICRETPGANPMEPCQSYKIPAFKAQEEAGLIWVRLDSTSVTDVLKPPVHALSKDFSTRIWSTSVKGSLINALENFLDGTHTHFVHSGLVRSEKDRKTITAEITPHAERVEIIYKNESSQNGIISKLFEPERYESKASFIAPCIAELEYTNKNGAYFMVTAYLVPETNTEIKVFAIISHRNSLIPGFLKHMVINPFFRTVLRQDKKILGIQQDCIDRFGGENFIVTKQDLMRPYIHKLLSGEDISHIPKSSTLIYL